MVWSGFLPRNVNKVEKIFLSQMCLVLIDRPVKRSVKPPFRRNLLGRLHRETIRKLMKMPHDDHDVLQHELRPTNPDILAELERKHMEADAHKHDLDSGLQAVISDVSEYETDDPIMVLWVDPTIVVATSIMMLLHLTHFP